MNRFVNGVALAWLLIEGLLLILIIALAGSSSDKSFVYVWATLGLASWTALFGAAVGRWQARRGRIWLLALVSPLCFLGPTLALALPSKRVRATLARDLTTGWRALIQSVVRVPHKLRLTGPSFPLGAPTVANLIVAVVISAAAFVAVFLAMLMWWVAATAGGSAQERSFSAGDWRFVLVPPSVVAPLTLTFFVARWISARRQTHRG